MGEPIKTGFPSHYRTEAAILTSRWHPTGLLSGIENRHVREGTAVLLENQRLYGDAMIDSDKEFRDMSIKLVAKVFPQLLVHKIGSVQPMLGPHSMVYFLKYKYASPKKKPSTCPFQQEADRWGLDVWGGHEDESYTLDSEDVCAITRRMKTFIGSEFDYTSDLAIDKLAGELINELNAEHLTDIYNNCGTVAVWDRASAIGDTQKAKDESFYIKLCELSSAIHRKTLRGGTTFFVMSRKHYDKYGAAVKTYNPSVCQIHVVDGWSKGILMGYAGESYLDRGYAYCPYISLSKTPVVRSEEFPPTNGLLTRYGKKLFRTGAKHYARLEIKNDD